MVQLFLTIEVGNMKSTIGIIGGCGPFATIDIENKILDATKRLMTPLLDQHYFNMLVFNYTQFSDRNDAISVNDISLGNQFLNCAKLLESVGINLLLIACQTAHVYLPQIKSAINIPILDIIDETVSSIVKSFPGISKVGLLSTEATQKKQLYQNALAPYDIEVENVSAEMQKKIMEAIYIIKTGINFIKENDILKNIQYCAKNEEKYPEIKNHPLRRILLEKNLPNPLTTIQEAICYLKSNSCQHIILGCTELPLILPYLKDEQLDVELIDPNTIVAESAVILADKLENKIVADMELLNNINNHFHHNEEINLCVE